MMQITHNVIVTENADAMSARAAYMIRELLDKNPRLIMCLAAGRTHLRTYAILKEMCSKGEVSFSEATLFAIDEYVGPPHPGHRTLGNFLRDAIVSHIDLPPHRFYHLNSDAIDLEAECARYEGLIRESGGLDFALLGIGTNGHIGFNEPGSAHTSRTRPVVLSEETIKMNASLFGGESNVPRRAITMGVATLAEARQVLLLACGEDKALAVKRSLLEPPSAGVPASALRAHANCYFILDSKASTLLKEQSR